MHAYEIPNLRFSLPAAAAVKRYRFMHVNNRGLAVQATAKGATIGVSMDDAAIGKVVDISDGIVMVEAAGAIAAGSGIEVAAQGKATTRTDGIAVGIALTSVTAADQIVTVKVTNASSTNGAPATTYQTVMYQSTDLAAGADLSKIPLGVALDDGTIVEAYIISMGAAAGIDAANTSVFSLAVGNDAKAGLTFDDTVAFPASGAKIALTVSDEDVAEGDILTLSVTNGATADLPVFVIQLVVALD